jgi:NTP pyrophosphatase (non-canonical NTP hydrolase)
MDMKTYLEESARTTADGFDNKDFALDIILLREFVALDLGGAMADAMKRSLFYSDDLFKRIDGQRVRIRDVSEKLDTVEETVKITADKDIIHAALGIASEAGELFEEIVKSAVEGRPVDVTNLKEEAGDVMWYLALLLRKIDATFEEVGDLNIAKLKKRFPDKFTKADAINRDLDEEKVALQG